MKGKKPKSPEPTTTPVPSPREPEEREDGSERLHEWRTLESLLQQALDLEGEEREAFLSQACRGREGLRREVESLLALEETAESFGETPYFPRREAQKGAPAKGAKIGPFRLVEHIARGGMGTVWRGVRVDREFHQQVAIKVLRNGREGAEILSRFRHERQILAHLNHPHIAKLLDGGTTRAGPYFIMEYVDGKHFDLYCREEGQALTERLDLFRTVCGAVEHAHRKLVIHRDLKPSNILVTSEGVPMLLDFGIAKILGPEIPAPTDEVPRRRRYTPGYGAPEQILGGPVSVATDVFSLGVLLHVAVTGQEPPKDFYPRPECWPRKSSSPQRELPRDLEAVVRKAMAEDPEKRYGDVRELSQDVGRFLAGEPVEAREGTFAYRAGRHLKRNWLPWAAAVIVAASLSLLAAQMIQERLREARTASVAENILEMAAQESPASASPFLSLVESGVSEVLAARGDRPQTRADLMEAMGKIYRSQGDPRRAKAVFEESLALRQETLAPSDAFIALSHEYLAYAEKELGNLEAGIEELEKAREIRLESGNPEGIAGVYNDLAIFRRAQGRFDEAVVLYRQALEWTARAKELEDPAQPAKLRNNLGMVLRHLGRYDEARILLEEAVAIWEDLRGPESSGLAPPLSNLGLLLLETGEVEEAGVHLRRGMKIRQPELLDPPASTAAIEPTEAPVTPTIAKGRRSLALYHLARGELEEAERCLQIALNSFREHYPGKHFQTARTLGYLAEVRLAQGRPAEAQSLVEEGLRISHAYYPGDHWQIADLEGLEGKILLEMGEKEAALALLRSARDRLAASKGEESRATIEATEALRRAQVQ